MTRDECKAEISRLVPDCEVRRYIFNRFEQDTFLDTASEVYKSYSRIFTLTFFLMYAKYRTAQNCQTEIGQNSNIRSYLRVAKTFSELYKNKSVGFSAIESTIIDTQLDVGLGGHLSNLLGLAKYLIIDAENSFASIARKAEMARVSMRGTENENLSQVYDELVSLLELFPYLGRLKFQLEEIKTYQTYYFNNQTKVNLPIQKVNICYGRNEEFDTFLTLIKIGNEYCYLQRIIVDDNANRNGVERAFLTYAKPESELPFLHVVATNDENHIGEDGWLGLVGDGVVADIIRDLRLRVFEDDSHVLVRDFYSINFRYVKQLALAIVDSFTLGMMRDILNAYRFKHQSLFPSGDLTDQDIVRLPWENIIAVLIVKESATNILQFILKQHPDVLRELLKKLQARFGAQKFNLRIEQELLKKANEAFANWKAQYFPGRNIDTYAGLFIEEQRRDIEAEVYAIQIVKYLSSIVCVDETSDARLKNNYPLNIGSQIRMLTALQLDRGLDLKKKQDSVRAIVLGTLKNLYVFYCGFFKYAEIKMKYQEATQWKSLSYDTVKKYQTDAEKAFDLEIANQTKRLAPDEYDVLKVLQEIEKLNKECTFAIERDGGKRKILKNCLGRDSLLDYGKIRFLDNLLAFKNDDENDFSERMDGIIGIYKYLQNGEKKYAFDGIYPYIGSFEYATETRDGFKTAHFSIIVDDSSSDVEMISEFQYQINNKYYCLPNKLCCNNELKLWIEPIIISCDDQESIGDNE